MNDDDLRLLQRHEGQRVWVTLAFADQLLCRVDLELDGVEVADGQLSLVGSFEETGELAIYREVNLPLPDEAGGVYVAAIGDETRVETEEGFFLHVVPL